MVTKRINFGFLVCFLIATLVGQTLSQTRRTDRTRDRLTRSQAQNIARKQRQQELEQRRLRQEIERQLKKQTAPAGNQEESMKQALGATQKQWKAIKPRLNKVRELKSRANVSIRLMCVGVGSSSMGGGGSSVDVKKGFGRMSGSGSGYGSSSSRGSPMPLKDTNSKITGSRIYYGWQWIRPSQHKSLENLNEGEKICEELFQLLEDSNSESEQEKISQKTEALRAFRQKAAKELFVAQQALRELVTPRQEATLIMMGLLD